MSSAILETAFKLGLGGRQRIRGEHILVCGEEHKRMLGATGRGTKKQAAQLHGYVVNNRSSTWLPHTVGPWAAFPLGLSQLCTPAEEGGHFRARL